MPERDWKAGLTPAPRVDNDPFRDDRTAPQLGHPLVFDREPVFTGLLDTGGRRLYRTMGPIGFVLFHTEKPKG